MSGETRARHEMWVVSRVNGVGGILVGGHILTVVEIVPAAVIVVEMFGVAPGG